MDLATGRLWVSGPRPQFTHLPREIITPPSQRWTDTGEGGELPSWHTRHQVKDLGDVMARALGRKQADGFISTPWEHGSSLCVCTAPARCLAHV